MCMCKCVCMQARVSSTLATLRNAGVRVWMLTGDKVETATSIAFKHVYVCIVYVC